MQEQTKEQEDLEDLEEVLQGMVLLLEQVVQADKEILEVLAAAEQVTIPAVAVVELELQDKLLLLLTQLGATAEMVFKKITTEQIIIGLAAVAVVTILTQEMVSLKQVVAAKAAAAVAGEIKEPLELQEQELITVIKDK